MHLIKLNATDSTNAYLKNLALKEQPADFTVIYAREQSAGRGQMGTIWVSEPGKNLTFSILKKYSGLDIREQFVINMEVSLAMYSALETFQLPDLRVKWPNDILSGGKKICGILIENLTAGSRIQSSIIGIGLNVNQRDFGDLKQVSSLSLLKGLPMDLEEVLTALLNSLQGTLGSHTSRSLESLRHDYEALLFRKDKPSTFRDREGAVFSGFIRGVNASGRLKVELEDAHLVEYDMKEVQLLH